MTPAQIGILGCILLIVLLVSSMPVAFVMAIVGGLGFAAVIHNPAAAYHMMVSVLYGTFGKYDLSVIPLFILMGQVSFHSGISRRLFDTAYKWLGQLPGGLAMATVGACTGFGAICGSGPATAATMAAVALPEMRRRKYSMELACGSVAAGGSLGMLIPPSVVFIVYGIMTEQSPGKLFIAGILPGILIAFLFCLTIYINCVRRPHLGPGAPEATMREKLGSLWGVSETVLLFGLVIGGMFFGWFTPTEAAAVGAAGSLLIALAKRQLSLRVLKRSLLETARTACMVMVIVAGALMFGSFLAVTRIPADLARCLSGLSLPGWLIMSVIVGFYLVAGCFVDALALILLTIPVFYPVIQALGYDPIWFGVMVVVVVQMGVISPPVGVNAYVVSGIERDVPLQTVFKGTMPFLGALVVSAVLLMVFPQISLFLPERGPGALLVVGAVLCGLAAQGGMLAFAARIVHAPRSGYWPALWAVSGKFVVVLAFWSLLGRFPGHGAAAGIALGSLCSVLLIRHLLRVSTGRALGAWAILEAGTAAAVFVGWHLGLQIEFFL